MRSRNHEGNQRIVIPFVGPVQSFTLSRLGPQLDPHGITVMNTGFQIAGA